MSKIKEAYDALVEAIKEETGATPNISIHFHCHYEGNTFFADNQVMASDIAGKMSTALEMLPISYKTNDNFRWIKTESGDHRTDIAVFM
jgi:hypothetical protein